MISKADALRHARGEIEGGVTYEQFVEYVFNEMDTQIINEKALKDDVVDGIMNYTNDSMTLEKVYASVTDAHMESVLTEIWDAESSEIVRIADEISSYILFDEHFVRLTKDGTLIDDDDSIFEVAPGLVDDNEIIAKIGEVKTQWPETYKELVEIHGRE